MLSESIIGLLRNPETPLWVIKDAVLEEKKDVHTLWVVYGSQGSYSDREEWSVRAFLTEQEAKDFHAYCEKWAEDEQIHRNSKHYCDWDEREAIASRAVHDPYMKDNLFCMSGMHYFIGTIPLAVGG